MAEMKDSGIEWIGEIPTDWDTKAIRFLILEHFSGAWGNDEKTDSDNNRICMRIADFDYFRMQFKENIEYTIRNYTNAEIANKTLRYGDLLIEKSGGGEKTPVGRTVVYRLNNNALFANFMDCIRLKEDEYNYEFAKYVFYSLYNNGITNLYYNKTTGIQNLSMQKYLREVKLPFPTLIEQGKIADFLDEKCTEIDTLHSDIEKQIETLEEYKKSIITEAVTKGLDPDVEMKNSGIEWIGMIPKEWECKKIKYVTNLSRGIFGHRPRNDPRYYDGEYPFIQTGDVACATKVITNYSQTLNELGKKVSKEFKKGSIALTIAANVGDVSILGFNAYFPDSIMAVIPHKGINNMYFYYILSIMKSEFLRVAIINTQLNLNVERVGNLYIPITFDKNKQKEIVKYLDKKCAEIDGAIEEKKEQLETLEQYKKSLIYEYVTGKKEVK